MYNVTLAGHQGTWPMANDLAKGVGSSLPVALHWHGVELSWFPRQTNTEEGSQKLRRWGSMGVRDRRRPLGHRCSVGNVHEHKY